METFKFHSDAPMLKYCQMFLNRCYLISLEPPFTFIKQTNDANAISLRIKEYLKSQVGNHVNFTNSILKNEKKVKATQECIIA